MTKPKKAEIEKAIEVIKKTDGCILCVKDGDGLYIATEGYTFDLLHMFMAVVHMICNLNGTNVKEVKDTFKQALKLEKSGFFDEIDSEN